MELHRRTGKPHAVLLPFPTQGHINPIFKFGILLHQKGFHITFVNTEYNHNRLLKSRGQVAAVPDFQFETIPDGLPPSDADKTQDFPLLFKSTKRHCLAPFQRLLAKLNSGSPAVTCVIADSIMTFAITAAREINVPVVCFRTTSASSFLCNKHIGVLIQNGLLPLKDPNYLTNGYLDTYVGCIPSLENIRLRDLPTFVQTTNLNDPLLDFLLGEAEAASSASAMVFNTFDALEGKSMAALAPLCPPVYAIGPVQAAVHHLPENSLPKSMEINLWKEESECLQWLNSREPCSVVYINFGSIAALAQQELIEFAWGLANSGKSFLWIIRSDSINARDHLPPDFVFSTKDRGLISGWCPQLQVLQHPSIAVFLTHCGWNSVVESLSSGVPMICWPSFADQPLNCRLVCAEWGVGIEIGKDLKREMVEKVVQKAVEDVEMKNRALEWKKKVEEAVANICLNFDKVVDEILLN